MKAILSTLFSAIILLSCSNKKDVDTLLLLATDLDKNIELQVELGNYKIADLKSEYITTKDSHLKSNKLKQLIQQTSTIDSICAIAIQSIDQLKISLLKENHENIKAVINYSTDKIKPISINYFELKNPTNTKAVTKVLQPQTSTKLSEQLSNLNQLLLPLAMQLATTTTTYLDFKPILPIISSFKNADHLEQQFEAKAKDYNNKEDRQIVQDIYKILSHNQIDPNTHHHWLNNYFINSNTLDAISKLTLLQKDILTARNLCLNSISSRINICSYGFTEIIALVNGPNTAKAGKDFTLKVGIGAFDSYNNPIVELEQPNGKTIEIKDGLASIKLKAKKGSQTIKGTVSIINKSGVLKTLPFEWQLLGIEN